MTEAACLLPPSSYKVVCCPMLPLVQPCRAGRYSATPLTSFSPSPFPEGRACAVVFDCKFIETSAAVQHNVKELFEGIVRQVRLRRDSKEKNERRLAYQKRRESIPRKARRFWGKIVAKNNKNMAFKLKSKSCHDLSVL